MTHVRNRVVWSGWLTVEYRQGFLERKFQRWHHWNIGLGTSQIWVVDFSGFYLLLLSEQLPLWPVKSTTVSQLFQDPSVSEAAPRPSLMSGDPSSNSGFCVQMQFANQIRQAAS